MSGEIRGGQEELPPPLSPHAARRTPHPHTPPARPTHPAHTYRHKMLAQNTVEKGMKKPGGTNASHHRALLFNS